MVLSDKFGGKPRPSLLKRTLLYVLSFGLGALLIVGVISFTMMSIAEGILPGPKGPKDKTSAAEKADTNNKDTKGKRPGSKARPGRGNEAPEDGEDQPL